MKTRRSWLGMAVAAGLAVAAMGQMKRVSPHETVSGNISGSRVMLVYGRPYSKDPKTGEVRKIWGTLVPYGKVWRMGADEATMLVTEQPLAFGETVVPAGAYTLYMLPNEDGTAKLIINKQLGQWGTVYKEDMDLARVDMKKDAVEKTVDQFTMGIAKDGAGGTLKATWENATYSVGFAVKK